VSPAATIDSEKDKIENDIAYSNITIELLLFKNHIIKRDENQPSRIAEAALEIKVVKVKDFVGY
jgi:hypothetical protein